ncbi:hypothetical protein MMC13_001373 [Lambiella insularis]|nr:hypothetical protein [Lambiella insularis]
MLIVGNGATDSFMKDPADRATELAGGVMISQPYQRSSNAPVPSSNSGQASYTPFRQMRTYPGNWYAKERRGSNDYDGGFSPEDKSIPSDVEKNDRVLVTPSTEKQHYARIEQRTILIKNLSDRTTHKDIVDIIRGGALLDIYIRSIDKIASVSFVEGAAAQAFMFYAKRNDIYIHGKRTELSWSDRQFILPGHVASKIHGGATRNLILRGIHPSITAERIREDLDHIHNLVVIDITFRQADAFISLNSVHNSLFARTCMMSRGAYKSARIEWYPDECAQSLPSCHYVVKKESVVQTAKTLNPMANRFQMLNMDGTEDGSEEDEADEQPTFALHPVVNWAASALVA